MNIYSILYSKRMIINIDLEDEIIKKVDNQAKQEDRSRKKMLELIVKRAFEI